MAKLGGEFDATRVEPEQPFDVLPAGKYLVMAVDSDVRSTKGGNGTYLWFEFEVLDANLEGPANQFRGRRIWDRINQENPKQQAVDIGNRRFSALCHAVGKLRVSDTAELHGIPVIATVRVRPAEGEYRPSNSIDGYAPAGGGSRTTTAPAQAATAAATAPTATAPWKRARG